jgi:hypothetical protein
MDAMGRCRECGRHRPLGLALFALFVGAGLTGCPVEEPKQEEHVTSAPFELSPQPPREARPQAPPLQSLQRSLTAEPKLTVGVA